MNSVRVYKRDKQVNHDCSLSSDEVPDVPIPAGMATIVDTCQYRCTSLISAVLDYHLRQMIDEGFVEEAWVNHMSRVGTIKCPDDSQINGFTYEEIFSLDLNDVGGSFVLHGLMTLIALTLALISFLSNPSKRKRTIQEVFGFKQAQDAVRSSLRRSQS